MLAGFLQTHINCLFLLLNDSDMLVAINLFDLARVQAKE